MSDSKLNIVCFGEVLYDVFPDKTIIGGAPLNVALRLASLGVNSSIISRVGNDKLGSELLDFVSKNGVSVAAIQVDDTLETGQVLVHLNDKGSASYTINYPAAWDKIEVTNHAENIVKKSDAFIFGSLASRDQVSYKSLQKYLEFSNFKVFDVNLRSPFYTKELIIDLMQTADFLKFNDDELFEISEFLNSPYHSLEQNIQFISNYTTAKQICVTKGSHGAVLYHHNKLFYNSGYKINVVDTVGSGDSFLAGLLFKLLTDCNPQESIDFACAVGAIVAQNQGANPEISLEKINNFINPVANK
jgi:fructokinase